ncbi:unnamed protein product (macronuclear) [Paramecium tetraurelia]|uniref:Uncharacterized protein n=1 Tax=Paramecium tetraurelia TaxID=5888 RepID=A0CBQ2_PARTE|nr:uncharacterized protein GSPATT00037002001 [Paramecium tetraurelia]CAK68219.1 unnamed protein product [Paramecium tetraurelia]|eukprot:XP_001435616.1 hypothetical protein (macronuclear) [Paramecium tetraurelia strain d4-2]
MKQTYNHLNPVFALLGSNSTQTSPMSTTDLNDSIEYYIDQKEYQTELEIVRYLHNLGVQTKTDPQIKEQQYWKEKRQRSQNIILDTIGNSADKIVLNPSVNRLLRKNVSQKRLRSNSPIFLLD